MPKAIWNGLVIAESGDTVVVEGRHCKDAVWYYPDPKPAADMVRDRVAFWKDVRVVD